MQSPVQQFQMQISVSNIQTEVPITVAKFRRTIEKLATQVFVNLRERLPSHLVEQELLEMQARGVLSVALVSNQKIRSLNKKWRQKDKATDVLSFSFAVEDRDSFEFALSLPAMPIELGDVIISAPRASSQAIEFGHSLERELYFLFVHGFLHVLGFDHMTKKDEKEMFGRQNEVLLAVGITR
jgi:probable rRNA maturation factor